MTSWRRVTCLRRRSCPIVPLTRPNKDLNQETERLLYLLITWAGVLHLPAQNSSEMFCTFSICDLKTLDPILCRTFVTSKCSVRCTLEKSPAYYSLGSCFIWTARTSVPTGLAWNLAGFQSNDGEIASFLTLSHQATPRTGTRHGSTARMLEICPRGNNKWLLLHFFVHDNCLLFML